MWVPIQLHRKTPPLALRMVLQHKVDDRRCDEQQNEYHQHHQEAGSSLLPYPPPTHCDADPHKRHISQQNLVAPFQFSKSHAASLPPPFGQAQRQQLVVQPDGRRRAHRHHTCVFRRDVRGTQPHPSRKYGERCQSEKTRAWSVGGSCEGMGGGARRGLVQCRALRRSLWARSITLRWTWGRSRGG